MKIEATAERTHARSNPIPAENNNSRSSVRTEVDYQHGAALLTDGDVLSHLVRALRDAKTVVISRLPGTWGTTLIASLAVFRMRGGRLEVVIDRKHSSSTRFKFLAALGANVSISAPGRDRFRGFIADGPSRTVGVAISTGRSASISGYLYLTSHDPAVVKGCYLDALQALPSRAFAGVGEPVVEACSEKLVSDLFRRCIPQYSGRSVTVRDVALEDVTATEQYTLSYRYEQAQLLIDYYHSLGPGRGIGLFDPLVVTLRGAPPSLLVPPVVERSSDGKLYLVDGHSRLAVLRDSVGLKQQVRVVVVDGVVAPLPSPPRSWDKVEIVPNKEWSEASSDARRIDTRVHRDVMDALDKHHLM